MKHRTAIGGLFVVLAVNVAIANPMTIDNYSFENATGYWAQGDAPSSWAVDFGAVTPGCSFNQSVGTGAGSGLTGYDGNNVFALTLDTGGPTPGSGSSWMYSQVLGTFAANTQYTLDVLVATTDVTSPRSSVIALAEGTTLPSILASTSIPWTSLSSAFQNLQLVVDTSVTPSLVGKDIRILLEQDATNTNWGRAAFFDNVRLDATTVPEPGTLALLALGAAVVLKRRRVNQIS